MKSLTTRYQNLFATLCEKSLNFDYHSCEILFSVRHTRNKSDYQLLTLHASFSKDSADNNIQRLGTVNISNNESVKIFLARYDFVHMKELITSINANEITLPNADAGHNKIKHGLDLEQTRDLTYSSPDARPKSTLSFLPLPEDGLTILELIDIKKNALLGISPDDIIKVDELLLKHSLFSITKHYSRVGNVLIFAALDSWRISFKEDFDGKGLRIMLVPMRPNLDVNDFALTVTSKEFDEFSGTQIIIPIQKSIYIEDVDQSGNIDIRLWDIKLKILCGRNQGRIFQRGHTTSYILHQKKRTGILRDSQGNILKEQDVTVTSPTGRYAKQPHTWSQIVQGQIDEARKKRLLIQKKLIQFRNGMHEVALDEIIKIINLKEAQSIKIWDPYIGDYYLDFLTFIESDCEIKVLSELHMPPGTSDEPKGFLRIVKAVEGIILDYSKNNSLKKYLSPIAVTINDKRNERSKEKYVELQNRFKEYLEDLRKRDLKLQFRYKGNGLGESFHDRFLIVDSRCWALGSSLNHIGNKHCIIMEIEYPELIEQEFDRQWKSVEKNSL